jgi:hypothetical protein
MASCLPIVKLCCLAGAGYITYTCSIELNTYGNWIRDFSLTKQVGQKCSNSENQNKTGL